ncbi:MAG: carboxymethylenebutenolidase [Actinomycetota bacterium]|jgi:carboxymethylenebutenolidase|nr:carboxymethylenebutenolidase [Actinomycetota bacterium]
MSDANISGRDVTVDTADGPMRIYEARPPGEARGAIVVVQEAFGVNSYIEDVTRRAAAAGYHAVAPDLFHRSGPGSVVEYGNFEKVMEYFKDVSGDDAVLTDVDAALAHLRAAGHADSRIGVVGFCFGGRVSFLVALRRALGAAVGFYGGGIVSVRFAQFPALVGETPSLQTPWLGLFGDEDASIPVDDVEQLREALRVAKVDTEIVRYPGAGHGFHCDQRVDYRPDDAADAWRRALDWFVSHLD